MNRSASRSRRPEAKRAHRSADPGNAAVGRAFVLLPVLAAAALFFACRGYTPGVAVADDYSFLARLRFQHPLDPFDSMGATYYWRPLSRQAWFAAIGPALLAQPWLAMAANLAALAVTAFALWRLARRAFPPAVAAAIAALPLASEPARALLAWPSGAQHLLAGACAALAVDLALGARYLPATLVAGAGLLCHESAGLALLAVPLIAWRRRRAGAGARATDAADPGAARRAALAAVIAPAIVLALWAWGYATATAHGVRLPPRPPGAFPLARIPDLLSRAIPAAFNFEDLRPTTGAIFAAAWTGFALVVLAVLVRRDVAARRPRAVAWLAAGAAWFLLGALPLTQLLPDWNAWRAWVPTLGLLVGCAAALGTLEPRLALGFAGLKLASLLLATPAPPEVPIEAPTTASHMSYIRLVRLQRTVASTRDSLAAMYPALPRGARVCYWNLPRLAEVGFEGSDALRTWYGDSTLVWDRFGGAGGMSRRIDALVEYHDNQPEPAVAIEPEALRAFLAASVEMTAHRAARADSLLIVAAHATRDRGPFYGTLAWNRTQIAIGRGDMAAMDSLMGVVQQHSARSADYYYLVARVAAMHRDWSTAARALQTCLSQDPHHAQALELLEILQEQHVLRKG